MPKLVLALLLCVVFALPRGVPAGDEIDYSAPYLVVEDGELVTKYPSREHQRALTETDAQAGEVVTPPQRAVGTGNIWGIVTAAIAAVIVLLVMIRRGRQREGESE